MIEDDVAGLIAAAVQRAQNHLERLPLSHVAIRAWHGPIRLAPAMLDAQNFPLFYLPVWVSRRLVSADREFHEDLAYSTLSGFCFVVLIDHGTDNDGSATARKLLPASAYFHSQFEECYRKYFENRSAFWELFERYWFEQADVTVAEAHLEEMDAIQFERISSRKTIGAMIPLAASAIRFGRSATVDNWEKFVRVLGAIQQLSNDLFGWERDAAAKNTTYLLSEYGRRARSQTSLDQWLHEDGIAWASELLTRWQERLLRITAELDCPDVVRWTGARGMRTRELINRVGTAIASRLDYPDK